MDGDFRTQLNPTKGHILAGVQIDEHRFLARVQYPQLSQIAPDPRDSEDKKKLAASKDVQDHLAVREEVQRLFEGAKAKNVPQYADYIVGLHHGQDGITPTIILYSDEPLETAVDPQFGYGAVLVPWGKKLVAIDGETQLAARYEAANREPGTQQDYVAIYVCHGHTRSWARQSFHDLNVLAVRPNAAVSIGMDARDPLTSITRQVAAKVEFFRDRVNKTRRQLRSSDPEVTTIAALRGGCITVVEGIGGVRYGTRPVTLEAEMHDHAQDVAIQWWDAVTEAIGTKMEDRENMIASAPAVMAAIGAMGNVLLDKSSGRGAIDFALLESQVKKLRSVDWRRGKHWEGIAGKFTPKGAFSIGGSKETAYAIFEALNDSFSPSFHRVRGEAASQEVA